jgi:hypothetical protein
MLVFSDYKELVSDDNKELSIKDVVELCSGDSAKEGATDDMELGRVSVNKLSTIGGRESFVWMVAIYWTS